LENDSHAVTVQSSSTRASEDGEGSDVGRWEETKGPLGLTLLYAPLDPLIDFVFVHGLGGGSRKSWSKSNHPDHYWPKEWLPRDPDFKNVRIHTFGYKSKWNDKMDLAVKIRDFAYALLGELQDSPHMRVNNV
jgi:hypothetical protein